PSDGPWSIDVNWGDGSVHTSFDTTDQGALSADHTFAGPGTFPVTVTVADRLGASTPESFLVTVANLAPVLTAASDQASSEGAPASFDLGSFTDAGVNDGPWSVDVNWNDGSHSTFTATTLGALGTVGHTYPDSGSYTATVS